MNLNKAIIIGNITRDPELKSLESGMRVCKFGVATNRTYKDKNGNKQESTEFHNIVSFGKTAENINQYMKKGDLIYIEGRISTRSWEKEGIKRYMTEIIADNVQFGPKRANNPQGGITPHSDTEQPENSSFEPNSPISEPEDEYSLDDIPF